MVAVFRTEKTLSMQKLRGFTQKQAESLTDLSRDQLRKLDEKDIVKPCKHPSLLYSWNQIIFLKSFSLLRKRWSFKLIEKALYEYDESMEQIIKKIPSAIAIMFGEFGIKPDIKILIQFDYLENTDDVDAIERMRNMLSAESVDASYDFTRQTHISVPKIIKELKIEAEKLEIDNLDLKIQ
jgi:hypothetical protein